MTTPAEEAWAASRDASWYARPNVHAHTVVHMAGRPGREGTMSRCGRSVLDHTNPWVPAAVPAHIRCRSAGCRQAWPALIGGSS